MAIPRGDSWIPISAMAAQAQQRWRDARDPSWAWMTMAPMGIQFSPLMVAVFYLLGVDMLYHLYSGFLACRFTFPMLDGPGALGSD